MKLEVGRINPSVILLLIVLLLGAGGYVWYKLMYTPAVATRANAQSAADQAQQVLASARQSLEQAQQEVELAKKAGGKVDDSVSKLQVAQQAITPKPQIDDVAVVLMSLAKKAGIRTSFDLSESDEEKSGGDAAEKQDIDIFAVGTYAQMMNFITLVEDTVRVKAGKAYVRGRLFNVIELGMTPPNSNNSSEGDTSKLLVAKPNEIEFKLKVRVYTSRLNDSSGSLNGPSVDGAATPAPQDSGAGGAVDGNTPAPDAGGVNSAPQESNAAPNAGGVPPASNQTQGDPNSGMQPGAQPQGQPAPQTPAISGAAG